VFTPEAAKCKRDAELNTFLAALGGDTNPVAVPKNHLIFRQGDVADVVFYIQKGRVRLTVVSKSGKQATIGLLTEGSFLGESALGGQAVRCGSAVAMTDCGLLRLDKRAMLNALHQEHAFSDLFVAYLLELNLHCERALADQLFNSTEKRLARALLLLAHMSKEGPAERVIPKISQETLAEMIGTTRARVKFFMNRFKKLGFINCEGGLQVHGSLVKVLLRDESVSRSG
jgi:CRP-like cAMP-binding protein